MIRNLYERFKSLLRGRHNSLRYKFYVLPRDYIIEFFFRLCGRKWIGYYAYRMDRESKVQAQSGKPISQEYIDGGQEQAEYLKKKGLTDGTRLLDYGCGVMRLRVWLEGTGVQYYGADISRERLNDGIAMLKERGIELDPKNAFAVKDYQLTGFDESDFDIVWAASVYTHIPQNEMIDSMRGIKPLLKPDGRFIFTFSPASSDQVERANQKDWWQPPAVIEKCAAEAGFKVAFDENWNNRGGGSAAILTV